MPLPSPSFPLSLPPFLPPSFPPSLPPPKGPRVKLLSAIGRKDEFSDNDEEDDDNNLVTYNDNGLTDSTLRNASS